MFESIFTIAIALFIATTCCFIACIVSTNTVYYHIGRLLFLSAAAATAGTGIIRFSSFPHEGLVSIASTIWGYFYILSCIIILIAGYLYFSRWNTQWKSFMALTTPFITLLLFISIPFLDSSRKFATEFNHDLLPVHIVSSMIGELLFFYSFAGSVLYLIMERSLKKKVFITITDRLPNLEAIEKFNRWSITYSLVLISAGLVIGIFLVYNKFGKLFIGTAKEVHIYFTWFVILSIFILRKRSSLSPHKISIINIILFIWAMFLFILNNTYIARGFHSFQ